MINECGKFEGSFCRCVAFLFAERVPLSAVRLCDELKADRQYQVFPSPQEVLRNPWLRLPGLSM